MNERKVVIGLPPFKNKRPLTFIDKGDVNRQIIRGLVTISSPSTNYSHATHQQNFSPGHVIDDQITLNLSDRPILTSAEMLRRRVLRGRRPWFLLLFVVIAIIFSLSASLFFYDWRPTSISYLLPPATHTPVPKASKAPRKSNSNFLSTLRETLSEQFTLYRNLCPYSDWARPVTNGCRNFTGSTETALSALAAFHLLKADEVPEIFDRPPVFLSRIGAEVGYIADYVIAPLISAYLVSDSQKYLDLAVVVGEEILTLYNESLFAPFIGSDIGQFGVKEVMAESISSLYPVLASLAHYTRKNKFMKPVKKFLSVVEKSITKNQIPNRYSLKGSYKGIHSAVLDIPWRVYADIERIGKILPDLKTDMFLDLVPAYLPEAHPLKSTFVRDLNEVHVFSIHPCSAGAYLPAEHAVFQTLVKKCANLVKRNPLPSRMNGASEFGTYDLDPGFAFEGELLELFWRVGEVQKARSMILDSLTVCTVGNAVTGMINATVDGRLTDNYVHPELFSRWIFNGALMDAGVPFDQLVISEGGHILKKKPDTKLTL
jgi:hypothetical protein